MAANLFKADLFNAPSKRGHPRIPLMERLLSHRKIEGDHWIWTGHVSSGYGSLCLWTRKGRINVSASRLSAALFLGLDLDDSTQLACHKNSCHMPLCFNPEHLYVGTHKTNVDDREEVGTNIARKGESQWKSRLTEIDVRKIRDDYSHGRKVSSLADKFGVTWMAIYLIIKRKNWKHVA